MQCQNISIYIQNLECIQVNYCFNNNSTFNDLLIFIAFFYPQSNICPCCKIKYHQQNYNKYIQNRQYFQYYNQNYNQNVNQYLAQFQNLEMNDKVYDYIFNKNIKNYQIVPVEKCICEKDFKPYFLKSKLEIYNILYKYKQEIKSVKNKVNEKESIITSFRSSEYFLKKENQQLQQNNIKTVELNNSLIKQMEIANKEIKKLKNEISYKDQLISDYSKNIKELLAENEKLKKKNEENKQLNNETNFTDFYDVIIDIKSIKTITKGWEIKMSEKGKENYEKFKDSNKNIKIGIIGNANKGKSFLLSKISKIELPSGTSIRTEGLSIKYPNLEGYEDRNIILLDSAGLETPVLKDDEVFETNKERNEINEQYENELFREKSREKIITDYFLQNYIINNSDILIVVVGILTYSEQKLLNKITKQFLNLKKNKIDKPLYIIHNLMTYEIKEQVEEYIKDFLLKSSTFDLEIGHKTSTKKNKTDGIYFYQKNLNQKVFHLIFARDNTPAGDYYNEFTLEFLEKSYQEITNLTKYDVIETIKDSFIDISSEILENIEKSLSKDNFDNSNANLIKLNNPNVILKKCFIDELGFSSLKANGYEPTYNIFKMDDNKISIRVEVPGNAKLDPKIEDIGGEKILSITGTKKKDKDPKKQEDIIESTREFGSFSFHIQLKGLKGRQIKNQNVKPYEKHGLICMEYELEDNKKEGKFETEDEI